jgi:hypothetical protein
MTQPMRAPTCMYIYVYIYTYIYIYIYIYAMMFIDQGIAVSGIHNAID